MECSRHFAQLISLFPRGGVRKSSRLSWNLFDLIGKVYSEPQEELILPARIVNVKLARSFAGVSREPFCRVARCTRIRREFYRVNLRGSRAPSRTTRISWSVNSACISGNSYLGIWQVTQLLAATLQIVLAACVPFDSVRAPWQARHLESYALGSRTSG